MYSVMIVDDEETIREKLSRLVDFESYGFRVCATAKNGAEAMELTMRHRPNLILLDVRMPVMDGLTFLQRLAERQWQDSSVIILSGYSDFEYAKRAMAYGVRGYLTKPVDVQEAGSALRQVSRDIEKREQAKKLSEYRGVLAELRRAEDEAGRICRTDKYFVLHILPRNAGQLQSAGDACQAIADTMARLLRVEGGEIFNTVSVFLQSYLVPYDLLSETGGTVAALVHTVDDMLRRQGLSCVLMWDTEVLNVKTPFMVTYRIHLEQLLRAAFYTGGPFLDWGALPPWPAPGGKERVSAALDALRAALETLVDEEAFAALESLLDCVRTGQYDMDEVDSISSGIHYLLADRLSACAVSGDAPPALEKPTWRDLAMFYDLEIWCVLQREKLAATLAFLHQNGRPAGQAEIGGWLRYVEEHYREPLTITQLAEHFHMNPAYLGRIFQKAVGMNFKQYLTRLRFAEAKRMLRTTGKYVYQIADELGFSESSYFIAKFTQEVGVSPSEYRNK